MKKALTFFIILCLLAAPVLSSATEKGDLISQGSKGDAVVRIQKRLFDLGFYTYKPTGSYQAVTRAAVVRFQVQAGIMSDGTIGTESMNLLFSSSARRIDFSPVIPLSFTGHSGTPAHRGKGMDWYEVKAALSVGIPYQLTNCYTGTTAKVLFLEGAYHAEMEPATALDRSIINGWIGAVNSCYKCVVVLELEGKPIAASIQWSEEHLCVYFTNSLSHVNGLADVEHESLIRLATEGGL